MHINEDIDKRIAIIVPYFGVFPSWFQAWWASALKNQMLEFWLFTDNEQVKSEQNIYVEHMAFSEYVAIIQSKYDFKIECSQPYKLCDYKPAYGDIFEERLKEYDYWGYCDIDLIFGNVQRFITYDILDSFDKIYISAHLSILKNNEKMRYLYKTQGEYPEYNYQEAFTTSDSCYFDEFRGMELKLIREKCKVFNDTSIRFDANPKKSFFTKNGKKIVALWDKGTLFEIDENGLRRELLYIHISKRKMVLHNNGVIEKMSIAPGQIICGEIPLNELLTVSSGGWSYPYEWWMRRIKAQLRRYSFSNIVRLAIRSKMIARLRKSMLCAK